MPFFLRKVRFNKWLRTEECPWLAEGELQADSLVDLCTDNNALSVWQIDDSQSNLERVIVALAANCYRIQNVDYIIFDQKMLSEIGVRVEKTEGNTHDRDANTSWHYDFKNLSAQKLMRLATMTMNNDEVLIRSPKKKIIQMVKRFVESGLIDHGKLSKGVIKEIS